MERQTFTVKNGDLTATTPEQAHALLDKLIGMAEDIALTHDADVEMTISVLVTVKTPSDPSSESDS